MAARPPVRRAKMRSVPPRQIPRAAARAVLAAAAAAALALGLGCGGGSSASAPVTLTIVEPDGRTVTRTALAPAAGTTATVAAAPPKPVSLTPIVHGPGPLTGAWQVVATVKGQPAAWVSEHGGVVFLRMDQNLVRLDLHAGAGEPAGEGWHWGGQIEPREIHRVLAAFNGGFKLNYGSVGFLSYGRVGAPLSAGLGSIVTYRDGFTQIGSWGEGVPQRGRAIASVRQNERLLIDHGMPAANVESCIIECWGHTIGGEAVPRSALGIDEQSRLVWAAGEGLTPAALARAMVSQGVQRAVELDINPDWVAGYLYRHRSGGPQAMQILPEQKGIVGQLLAPYARDFFVVISR